MKIFSVLLFILSLNTSASDYKYLLCNISYSINGEHDMPYTLAVMKNLGTDGYLVSAIQRPFFGKDYYSKVFRINYNSQSSRPKIISSFDVNSEDQYKIQLYGWYSLGFSGSDVFVANCEKTDNFNRVLSHNAGNKVNMSALKELR